MPNMGVDRSGLWAPYNESVSRQNVNLRSGPILAVLIHSL